MSHPRRSPPEPAETNEITVVGVMTAIWAVAAVVLFLFADRLPPGQQWWVWTSVAGCCGGLAALVYLRDRRRRITKRARG